VLLGLSAGRRIRAMIEIMCQRGGGSKRAGRLIHHFPRTLGGERRTKSRSRPEPNFRTAAFLLPKVRLVS
jgi:hypothetical protein